MTDKKIFRLIEEERNQQNKILNLIASENYASENVIRALGSVLTNKYAEGTPEFRYYKGCKVIDKIENLAIERLISLFHAEAGNVQPHSGTQANMAVYFAVLNPGDYVLSLSTVNGGHLSHGSLVNFSGELYNFVHYGVDENGFIDYENVEYLAKKYRPKLIEFNVDACSSWLYQFSTGTIFGEYTDEVIDYIESELKKRK